MTTLQKWLLGLTWAAIAIIVFVLFRINIHGKVLTKWTGDKTSPVTVTINGTPVTEPRAGWAFREWTDSVWVRLYKIEHRLAALQKSPPDFHLPPPPPPPDW